MNPVFAFIVHWLHLLAAIVAIGGTICLRIVVHPALNKLEGEAREAFEKTVRRKGSMLVLHSLMLAVITGFMNFVRVFSEGRAPEYIFVFLAKVVLAMSVLGISLGLTLQSDALEKFQANRPRWLLVNIVLGVLLVAFSARLRLIK